MKRMICAGLGVCLLMGPTALGQEDEAAALDPIEILKKVDEAAKAVKAVQYEVQAKAEGTLARYVSSVEGTMVLMGTGEKSEKFRLEGEVQAPRSSQKYKLTVGCDGETFYLIDHAEKTVHADTKASVLGRFGGAAVDLARMVEFVHPTPFTDEIKAEEARLKGETEVGGEACYHIRVKYKDASGARADWYFAKSDYLPRRVDRKMGGGELRLELSALEVYPELGPAAFELVVPAGFSRTTDAYKDKARAPRGVPGGGPAGGGIG